MSLELEAADLLERTADALESGKVRWCQGTMQAWDGRMCAVGALRQVGTEFKYFILDKLPPHVGYAHEQVEFYLGKTQPGPFTVVTEPKRSLAGWNDHKARNVGEVIDVFKQTAKEIRNGQ